MSSGRQLLLAALLAVCSPVHADNEPVVTESNALNVFVDLTVLRPVGLVGTLAGGTLLVASSPFTLLANTAPPHDAFQRAADALLGVPACYTFLRPLGQTLPGQFSPNYKPCHW